MSETIVPRKLPVTSTLCMAIPKTKLLKLVAVVLCVITLVKLTRDIVWQSRRLFNLRILYYGTSAELSPHLPLVLDFTLGSKVGSQQPACVLRRSDVKVPVTANFQPGTIQDLEAKHKELKPGGRWRPTNCSSHKVALIVPYRNRTNQLKVFLSHMHPFLQQQKLDYGIYIVEPDEDVVFNRGLLMNIGFVEALRDVDWQCFALHDVDLYPLDGRNVYSCPRKGPRHHTSAIDKYSYRLPYSTNFGGGCMFSKDHYMKINGFSNKYFGWGGEDDDLYERVIKKKLPISRYPWYIATYATFRHDHEASNAENPERVVLLKNADKRQDIDGLNTVKYSLIKREYKRLYTWIHVKINQTEIMKG